MRNFIKMFFACLLAIGFSFLFFFIIFTMLASLGSQSSKKSGAKANSVLNLTLKGEITDRTYDNPFRNLSPMSALTGAISSEPTIGLYDLKNVIKYAKTDDHIKGIYLNIDEAEGGPANMFDLADALEDFKKSGKFIYAYSKESPELNVMLNNIADKYFVNPVGGIEFDGFGTEMEYYKNLMDKLGVEYKVFYVGEYKSATESFRRTDMSPEDKIQRTELLKDIYTEYMTRLAKYTGSTFDQLKSIQDNLSIIKPEDIVANKLADGLKYEDEVKNEIKTKLGYKKDEDLNLISYKDYEENNKDKINKSGENKIALVFAEGTIDDSKEDEGTIGGEAYVKMLQKIEQDKDIKALVLRVSSPGGSAFASEQILHQIQNIKKRIPVVVSMGNYAASGGYYISAYADTIVAEP
ncbi:MAG TPA: S49 family peptidase, partial [Chitinophagales bacterium]|nr:S49 family peptidase [Chitinophagales bacterium]